MGCGFWHIWVGGDVDRTGWFGDRLAELGVIRSELDRVRLSGSVWVCGWALTHRGSAFGSVIGLLWRGGLTGWARLDPAWAGSMSVAGSVWVDGWALFFLSLSLSFAHDPEMNWSENESVKSFLDQRSKFLVKGNDFPENRIFHSCQTRGSGGKWFPETIFTQNKRTKYVINLPYSPRIDSHNWANTNVFTHEKNWGVKVLKMVFDLLPAFFLTEHVILF